MRDHRPDLDPDAPKQRDITEQVRLLNDDDANFMLRFIGGES